MTHLQMCLHEAAFNAVQIERKNEWSFDTHAFVRNFLEAWLFSNVRPQLKQFDSVSGSFIFLLHKNLSVTNVSVNELIALTRLHTINNRSGPTTVNFFHDDEYESFIENLWVSAAPRLIFDWTAEKIKSYEERVEFVDRYIRNAVRHIVQSHGKILENTIIFRSFYTTVLMHIPKSLSSNLYKIVFESGYIHSAGPALYVRKIEKATCGDLEQRLDAFLKRQKSKRLFATPYADEFFSPHDHKSAISTRNGLDGVKLKLSKYVIDGIPLSRYLLTVVPSKFSTIYTPKGLKPYLDERRDAIKANCSPNYTIWFISDSDIELHPDGRPTRRGNQVYLIVYAQYLLNDNQFVIFKERKPAWYASITLPHTLSIGCVNILRHALSMSESRGNPVFVDPFCGTGTSLFDAALRIPNAVVIGLDREQLTPSVIRDNLMFFSSDKDALNKLADLYSALSSDFDKADFLDIEKILDRRNDGVARAKKDRKKEFGRRELMELAVSIIARELDLARGKKGYNSDVITNVLNKGFSRQLCQSFNREDFPFELRVLTYAVWRAIATGYFSLREAADLRGVIGKEIAKISREIAHIARVLNNPGRARTQNFLEFTGDYSRAGATNPTGLRHLLRNFKLHQAKSLAGKIRSGGIEPGIHAACVDDSLKFLQRIPDRVDVIFTDPPYGFNIQERVQELYDLYKELIPTCMTALRSRGHLFLVLPAFTRTGRQVPFFETAESIIRQILGTTHPGHKKCKRIIETFPEPKQLFTFPLYWSSADVLERKLLHFVVE